MNLSRAGQRLAGMSGRERRAVMEAAWSLTSTSIRLRRMSWEQVRADLLMVEGRHDPFEHHEVVSAIERVARRLPGRHTCLPQALAAQRMLRRREVASRVEFDLPDLIAERPGHARVIPD